MPRRAYKVAFIGSHGVGKTTLCYGLAARLKARDVVLEVVHEVARRCPLPINEETSVASESWILHTQVAEELLAAARYEVVVCDRSALDNYVYLLAAAGRQDGLDEFVERWMATYDLLVHVPILDLPAPDGMRAVDPGFQHRIEERLARELAERALGTVTLPLAGVPRERWLDHVESAVWAAVRPPQLELLAEPASVPPGPAPP